MGADTPSVVTVTGGLTAQPSGWINLTQNKLPIAVTDAEGDPPVSYRFTDFGTGPTSAQLWYNSSYVGQGGTVTVPASQLSNLWIQAGSAYGSDTLQVQVYDGYAWSAAQNIAFLTRAPNHAPVVVADATNFALNQTVALSSIFKATDSDSDPIIQYKITDTTVGGASLLLNGVQQAENSTFTINAANLSQWQILTSSVNKTTNTFTVQAYDNFNWSTATSISVTSQAPNTPSVVTVTSGLSLSPGGWLNLAGGNLPITVVDADGDPIVSYRFVDIGSGATTAQLWSGSGYVPEGGTVTLTPSQLATTWIQGGASNGTDTLQVQVFDGFAWSTAKTITVITHPVNHPPVVAAAFTNYGLNQTIAASSIFKVTDADGDAITQYRLTDATAGGAHLTLNGVTQADNTAVTVSAANLSQLQIVTASADQSANAFIVQAFDGFDWSAATTVNVASVETDSPPVITVIGSLTLQLNAWLNLTQANLPITVADADGDAVVSYRFTDIGTDSNGAYLWFNANVAQGGTVTVPANQLSSFWIHGGAVASTDTLAVQVFDGYAWSAAQTITVSTRGANHIPVVAAAATSLAASQTVALSSIFSVTDSDGDAITQYKVSDTTVGGAHLLFNGLQQAENTVFTINAANLSQWQIATSAVTHDVNQFQVSAYDGLGWSLATAITTTSGNNAPVETVTAALQLAPSQWLAFSPANLPISVIDADGDSVASYKFTDIGAGATSAHLWYGSGVPRTRRVSDRDCRAIVEPLDPGRLVGRHRYVASTNLRRICLVGAAGHSGHNQPAAGQPQPRRPFGHRRVDRRQQRAHRHRCQRYLRLCAELRR